MPMSTVSAISSLERLLEVIQVPQSRYEAANRAFKSLCDWLTRPESSLKPHQPESYLQGSFRLGTAIKPLSDDDDYDVDVVASLRLTKDQVAPSDLKEMVGNEVKAYSKRYGMKRPAEGRRCWTQDYADEAQFHIDTLPAIPDSVRQRVLLEDRGLSADWAEHAIAITDTSDPNYYTTHDRWPLSNPRGYAQWFEQRMATVLRMRRDAIALQEQKRTEEIPTYRARVPLQSVVQLLKFHRDVMFVEDPDDKPISIIITTLAAKSYNNEDNLFAALQAVLSGMDNHIEQRLGIDWIANPTNALENFADKWPEYPARRSNFYKWLETARSDFGKLAQVGSREEAQLLLEETFGSEIANRVEGSRPSRSLRDTLKAAKLRLLGGATHKQQPPWSASSAGSVRIYQASKHEHGFRPVPFSSDSAPVRKGADLTFFARTDVPMPYEVYWQVVNTGEEAERVNGLRGGFDTGSIFSGKLIRKEGTQYRGTHSIECFVVKNGYLAARSGPFIVNVQ